MAKNGPVHEIRNGAVKVSIWRNEGAKGVFYNTTLERLYRKGKEWKSSASFSRDQLLVVAKVAQEANNWIYEELKADRKGEATTGEDAAEQTAA